MFNLLKWETIDGVLCASSAASTSNVFKIYHDDNFYYANWTPELTKELELLKDNAQSLHIDYVSKFVYK